MKPLSWPRRNHHDCIENDSQKMSSSSSEQDFRLRDGRLTHSPHETPFSRHSSQDDSHDDSRRSVHRSKSSKNKVAECIIIGRTKLIEIWSKHLINAIERVYRHPPLQSTTDFFTEQEPYPTLFHHMDDIKAEIAQMNNRVAGEHLEILQKEIAYLEPVWNEARQETDNMTSYGMIWKFFRLGDVVLREDDLGNLCLLVLARFEYGSFMNWKKEEEKEIRFNAWSLTWGKVVGNLIKRHTEFTCSEFSGKRHITSLPVYPIRYLEKMERDGIKGTLAKRGRRWQELITAASICQHHCGLALIQEAGQTTGEKFQADGRIIIDEISKGAVDYEHVLGSSTKALLKFPHIGAFVEVNDAYRWDSLPATTKLSDEQAMLCPAVIGCHDLRSRQTYTVSVDNLQPVEWNKDAMDHLVLDTRKKDMLKGLVRHHSSRSRRNEKADLIAGKGQSLIILLHGPPGVGKTLTAESTAEAVGKPLLAMSIGEMVWDETQLQERLRNEFQRAIDWDAVLLLDEADVVLEARSFEDVRRNGIVSIFLRELEYYRGILFLTTNRVSTMDTAFQSRIQIGIGFQSMTPKVRAEVWTQLLTLNGRDKLLGSDAIQSIQTRLSKYELNGRQIRNVLNVAESLAFSEYGEEGKLKYRHVEEAVKAAAEFQKVLEESKSMLKLEQTVWAPYKGHDD
ncbi:P-loop containing nucleoside triphosphate hydrolase protein [Trichoderma austrokoningii]